MIQWPGKSPFRDLSPCETTIFMDHFEQFLHGNWLIPHTFPLMFSVAGPASTSTWGSDWVPVRGQWRPVPTCDGGSLLAGWWYTYPSAKYESQLGWWLFPNIWKNNIHVPNHQPGNPFGDLFRDPATRLSWETSTQLVADPRQNFQSPAFSNLTWALGHR